MSPSSADRLAHWDLFCHVVDNYGDVGVCWRLARALAGRGHRVRLWIDDAAALRWMAPGGAPGVEVRAWREAGRDTPPGQVVVEAFGCALPDDYVAAMAAAARPPVWVNLEYLSAEPYVERSHGLMSPQMSGAGRGLVKWFFYPGFAPTTGGLLREPGLEAAQAAFDRAAWLAAHAIAAPAGTRLVSLFCYSDAPVDRLVRSLAADGVPTRLLVAPGAPAEGLTAAGSAVAVQPLPFLPQDDYDRLLWACDLNFVRGEDSWVRAHWAGRPFVWQAYRQQDGAQAPKVQAFLDRMLAHAPPAAAAPLRQWTLAWNALAAPADLPPWSAAQLQAVGDAQRAWRAELLAGPELASCLAAFVEQKTVE